PGHLRVLWYVEQTGSAKAGPVPIFGGLVAARRCHSEREDLIGPLLGRLRRRLLLLGLDHRRGRLDRQTRRGPGPPHDRGRRTGLHLGWARHWLGSHRDAQPGRREDGPLALPQEVPDASLDELAHRNVVGLAERLQPLVGGAAYTDAAPSLLLGHDKFLTLRV